MPNRVIFDCERMKYENTGLYHYCLNLGNHIQKFSTPQTEELFFYSPYGTQYLFGETRRHIIQTELHKLWMPDLKEFSVWHATHQASQYLPFRNKRIRVVLTVHDLNFIYDPLKSAAKKRRYCNRLQKLIDRADTIICVSEYSKKDLLFYCDVKDKPVHVVLNGTNSLTAPELLMHSYRPSKPFIFSVGTINRKKNFHTLLPLVSNGNMQLVIAGRIDDTDYYRHILGAAEKMNIAADVTMLGQVTEAEKSWYFNNCAAFAFPSTAEGFGLPVAEAMSVGKPLFLAGRTALPEIGGNVAFYFPDFSETIMQETFTAGMKKYKRFNMQEEIIRKGKEFCWDNAAQEYLKIYRSLY
jgi:glycosyltransferase involved in cell wall biosynthesis